jgi:hypothetical protein
MFLSDQDIKRIQKIIVLASIKIVEIYNSATTKIFLKDDKNPPYLG